MLVIRKDQQEALAQPLLESVVHRMTLHLRKAFAKDVGDLSEGELQDAILAGRLTAFDVRGYFSTHEIDTIWGGKYRLAKDLKFPPAKDVEAERKLTDQEFSKLLDMGGVMGCPLHEQAAQAEKLAAEKKP